MFSVGCLIHPRHDRACSDCAWVYFWKINRLKELKVTRRELLQKAEHLNDRARRATSRYLGNLKRYRKFRLKSAKPIHPLHLSQALHDAEYRRRQVEKSIECRNEAKETYRLVETLNSVMREIDRCNGDPGYVYSSYDTFSASSLNQKLDEYLVNDRKRLQEAEAYLAALVANPLQGPPW